MDIFPPLSPWFPSVQNSPKTQRNFVSPPRGEGGGGIAGGGDAHRKRHLNQDYPKSGDKRKGACGCAALACLPRDALAILRIGGGGLIAIAPVGPPVSKKSPFPVSAHSNRQERQRSLPRRALGPPPSALHLQFNSSVSVWRGTEGSGVDTQRERHLEEHTQTPSKKAELLCKTQAAEL